MSEPTSVFPQDPAWPGDGTSRIPFWAYTREDLYKKELDRLFYSGHWCYVGLEAEIPKPGDYRTTLVGETPVVVTRKDDGVVAAFVNRCGHRGRGRFSRHQPPVGINHAA